jgi:hypothetical protein
MAPRKKAKVVVAGDSQGKSAPVKSVSTAAKIVKPQNVVAVTPEKKIKQFYCINKKTKAFVKHDSQQLAVQWLDNLKSLDSEVSAKFIVQDFSSEEALLAFLDSMDFMGSTKRSVNPMSSGICHGNSGTVSGEFNVIA